EAPFRHAPFSFLSACGFGPGLADRTWRLRTARPALYAATGQAFVRIGPHGRPGCDRAVPRCRNGTVDRFTRFKIIVPSAPCRTFPISTANCTPKMFR